MYLALLSGDRWGWTFHEDRGAALRDLQRMVGTAAVVSLYRVDDPSSIGIEYGGRLQWREGHRPVALGLYLVEPTRVAEYAESAQWASGFNVKA